MASTGYPGEILIDGTATSFVLTNTHVETIPGYDMMFSYTTVISAPIPPPVRYIYRGRSGGSYVYSTGSPPTGATDVVIIGMTGY